MYPKSNNDSIEQIAVEYANIKYNGVYLDRESVEETGYTEYKNEKTVSSENSTSDGAKWIPANVMCAKCIYKDTCCGPCSLTNENINVFDHEEQRQEKEEAIEI